MDKLDKRLYKLFAYFSAFLMFFMTFLIFAQVIFRYFVHSSLTWSEEMGRYLFVWMTFTGMAAALYSGAHVTLDIVLKHLRGGARKALVCFNDLLVVLFSGTVIYSGIKLCQLGLRQRSSALRIPMNYLYVIIPVCGAILFYFAARRLWKSLRSPADAANAKEAEKA